MPEDIDNIVEGLEERRTETNKIETIPKGSIMVMTIVGLFVAYLFLTKIISIKMVLVFGSIMFMGLAFSIKKNSSVPKLLGLPQVKAILDRDLNEATIRQTKFPHGFPIDPHAPPDVLKIGDGKLIKDPVTYSPEYYRVGFKIRIPEDESHRFYIALMYPYDDNPNILGIQEVFEEYKGDDEKIVYKYVAVGELDKWKFAAPPY